MQSFIGLFEADVARALAIAADRVQVESTAAGSVMVTFRIYVNSAADELNLRTLLNQLVNNRNSAIYTGAVTKDTDDNYPVQYDDPLNPRRSSSSASSGAGSSSGEASSTAVASSTAQAAGDTPASDDMTIIIGAAVGGVIVLGLVAAGICYMLKRKPGSTSNKLTGTEMTKV
jgi:hypothetical protein